MDYSIYRFVACMDWVRLEVEFSTPTNFMAVQRTLNEILRLPQGENVHVEAVGAGAGDAATCFAFTLQEPGSWRDVVAVLDALRAWRPFATQPRVIGVEIALDGYSRLATWRPELVALAEHFSVYLARPASDNRRFGGLAGTVSGVYDREQTRRMLEAGRPLVIGNNATDEWSQRIYVKRTDKAGRVKLPEHEHRARMENTYRNGGLPVQMLDGWASFRFEGLSKHFNFRRPVETNNPIDAVVANANTRIGERRKRNHRTDGRVDGVRVYSVHVQADIALNRRAYEALRSLSGRWAK